MVVPMPVCLKCGKEIDPGNNFCEDCRALGPGEVRTLMDMGQASKYKPKRSRGIMWLSIFTLILFLIALAVGWALLTMIPTSSKARARVQSDLCHSNLVRIQSAIDKYYKNSHQYPPAGKLTDRNPLIIDGYLSGAPHCPTTKHDYILKMRTNEAGMTVICDSGLSGHSL
jgi:hypothetical protein